MPEDHAETYLIVARSEDFSELGHVGIFEIAGNFEHGLGENAKTSCHVRISDLVRLSIATFRPADVGSGATKVIVNKRVHLLGHCMEALINQCLDLIIGERRGRGGEIGHLCERRVSRVNKGLGVGE